MYDFIDPDHLLVDMQKTHYPLIDVREEYEFQSFHLPHAINIPLNDLLRYPHDFLSMTQIYYIICHKGVRSAYACQFLSDRGYKVINVLYGVDALLDECIKKEGSN